MPTRALERSVGGSTTNLQWNDRHPLVRSWFADMLASHALSRDSSRRLEVSVVVVGLLLLAIVIGATRQWADDVGDSLTRNTVRLSLAWYAAALVMMLGLAPGDWTATTFPRPVARWCWAWGIVCFLSTWGWRFTIASLVACARLRAHAAGQRHRRRDLCLVSVHVAVDRRCQLVVAQPGALCGAVVWIDRALHAFMLAIVFNGMIVFEEGPIRWAGWTLVAVLAAAWLARVGRSRVRESLPLTERST